MEEKNDTLEALERELSDENIDVDISVSKEQEEAIKSQLRGSWVVQLRSLMTAAKINKKIGNVDQAQMQFSEAKKILDAIRELDEGI